MTFQDNVADYQIKHPGGYCLDGFGKRADGDYARISGTLQEDAKGIS
jgi:hypothetical protein